MTHALGHLKAYHVPKCMSCHKDIVMKTGKAHSFHDFINIYLITTLGRFYIYIYYIYVYVIYVYIYIYIYIYIIIYNLYIYIIYMYI